MKLLLTISLLIYFFSFPLRGQTPISSLTRPIEQLDFNSGKWTLVLNEIVHDTTLKGFGELDQNLTIINDYKILDSLKSEFECNLDKQIDGYHEFVISLYKDNKIFEEYVFDSQRNFDFGELKKYFQPIKMEKTEPIIGSNNLTKKKRKLLISDIDFYYSSKFQYMFSQYGNVKNPNKNNFKNDFTFTIEISFSNLHSIGIDTKGAISELTKIYPELKNTLFSCNGNKRKNDYRYYQISFPCSSEFVLDSDKLKKKDNVVSYKIIGIKPTVYFLTTFIK